MDEVAQNTSLSFAVDPEHGALRSSVFALFFALWIASYALLNLLFPGEGLNILAGAAGFGIAALLVSQVIEPFLKARWPSGRALEIDERGVRLTLRGQPQKTINAAEPVSILLWSFKIKHRRNRVPMGWFVMACALEQDDLYLPVYALVSPEQAEALQAAAHFTTLVSEKDAKTRDTRHESLRVTGEQRRLRLAESHRWADGAEMTPADFERLIARLNAQFAQWMPFQK